MRKRNPPRPPSQARRWWRGYGGGCLLLVLSLAMVAWAAGIEDGLQSFAVGLLLVAAVIGGGVVAWGTEVLPAALLALVGLLAGGAALRTVLPRPAMAFELNAHRPLPLLAGSTTVPGAHKARSVTHRVVPLAAPGWQPGAALDTWALDPPASPGPGPARGLRVALDQRDTARAAWRAALAAHRLPVPAAEPTFVLLLPDPEAEDQRRVSLALAVLVGVLAPWLVGKPLARALARRGARPGTRAGAGDG